VANDSLEATAEAAIQAHVRIETYEQANQMGTNCHLSHSCRWLYSANARKKDRHWFKKICSSVEGSIAGM